MFVYDELEVFFFFFLNGKKKTKGAKKMLMDEMLCTYGMENCAWLSQKAASEECIVAVASQVPDPLAPRHHCAMCLALVLHSSRHAGRSYSVRQKLLELLGTAGCAKEDPLLLTLLSTHRSIKELNSSHLNFLPTSAFWLSLLWGAAVFQLMLKLTHSTLNYSISS